MSGFDPKHLGAALRAGDRRALARAITLVESTRDDHRAEAEALLAEILPAAGGALRLGITGAPGVGKSTFIEAFGLRMIGAGRKVAVLAVDPSSRRSGGSILGDKTRMQELARSEAAFIRPSPAGRTLGGIARRTREALLVCEAAGFDLVVVETVGVGQSEVAVSELTDMFLLLLQPAAGDELQGFKRGIVELADLVVVNKADGELEAAAARAAADYRAALGLLIPASPDWRPPVLECSALTGRGLDEVERTIAAFREVQERSGAFAAKRAAQAQAWMWRELEASLTTELTAHPAVRRTLPALEAAVADGRIGPSAAARTLLAAFLGEEKSKS